jgi:micrococcal nuclease
MRAELISILIIATLCNGILFLPPSAKVYAQESNCDPSYQGVCIPPYPPDLSCGDISDKGFAVQGSDPHGFDGDGDGIGCES